MASLNKVILIGNLTADPELKQTQSGISVSSFSIAVSRRYVNRSAEGAQNQQTADFINIVAWRQQADFICKYFRKGRPICIVGALQSRSWTDAQSGQRRYATEVVVDEVSFVDSKPEGSGSPAANAGADQQNAKYVPEAYGTPAYNNVGNNASSKFEEVGDDDNLPF